LFRGNNRSYGELTPRIFRKEYDELIQTFRPKIEFEFIEEFKRRAPVLSDNLPDRDNHIEWLFIMQHHGAPTRLLDWSESIFVAYFAVSELPNEDGELWAMYPPDLNEKSGLGLPLPNSRHLRYLASEPMWARGSEKLAEELKLEKVPEYPIAFSPPMNFPRMVSQLSAFTIHPRPRKDCTIPELLVVYVINRKYLYMNNLFSILRE
jgi:hypothetical protein